MVIYSYSKIDKTKHSLIFQVTNNNPRIIITRFIIKFLQFYFPHEKKNRRPPLDRPAPSFRSPIFLQNKINKHILPQSKPLKPNISTLSRENHSQLKHQAQQPTRKKPGPVKLTRPFLIRQPKIINPAIESFRVQDIKKGTWSS